jgi:hypothetical protein
MMEVRQQEPVERFDDPLWLGPREHFDLDQVIEEAPDRTSHCSYGGITIHGVRDMSVVSLEESFDVGRTQLVTAFDVLLQQKAIELATFGQQFTAGVASIAFGLEISGEAIEMNSEQTATKIDQSPLFFEPVFEHKKVRFEIETGGAKVNDYPFTGGASKIPPARCSC